MTDEPVDIAVIDAPDGPLQLARLHADRVREAVVYEGPACISNHWLTSRLHGRPRWGNNSRRRLARMQERLPALEGDFNWMVPPVLDGCTRMAAELDAALRHGSGAWLARGAAADAVTAVGAGAAVTAMVERAGRGFCGTVMG